MAQNVAFSPDPGIPERVSAPFPDTSVVRYTSQTLGPNVPIAQKSLTIGDNVIDTTVNCHHFKIWNMTANPIFIDFDTAAGLGSIPINAGGFYGDDVPFQVLHIYVKANTTLNGAAEGLVVVRCWQ